MREKTENIIMVYSEDNYTLEDCFNYEKDNGYIDENLSFSDWEKDTNNINKAYDYISCLLQDDFISLKSECNYILKNFDFVEFQAVQNRWNGQNDLNAILFISDISDIMSRIEFDRAEIKLYSDRIEIQNIHHDGTNYYDLYFKNWKDYRKKDITSMIKERLNDEEIKEIVNNHYIKSLYQSTKNDLIYFFENFCNDEI